MINQVNPEINLNLQNRLKKKRILKIINLDE